MAWSFDNVSPVEQHVYPLTCFSELALQNINSACWSS